MAFLSHRHKFVYVIFMDGSRTLFVTNIPVNVADDAVLQAFGEIGAIAWNRVGSTCFGFLGFRGDLQVKGAMAVLSHLGIQCSCDNSKKARLESTLADPRLNPELAARRIRLKLEAGTVVEPPAAADDNVQGPDGTLTDSFDTEGIPIDDLKHDIRIWRLQSERLRRNHQEKVAAAAAALLSDKSQPSVSSEPQETPAKTESSKWDQFLHGISEELVQLGERCEALTQRMNRINASRDMQKYEMQTFPGALSEEWYEKRKEEVQRDEQDRQAEQKERSRVVLKLNVTASRDVLEKVASAVCGDDPSEAEDRAEIVEFLEDLLPTSRNALVTELTDLLGEEDASRAVNILMNAT